MAQPQRVHGTISADEVQRLQSLREQIEAERPEIIERARRRALACMEDTFSGELRRAIAASPLRLGEVASQAGIPVEDLAKFLNGEAPLNSDAIDQIAELLSYRFAPAQKT